MKHQGEQVKKIYLFGKKTISHPLFTGSFFMVVGSNFSNFLAYIYHLVFGRILGPSNYGELSSLLALLGLIATLFSFLGIVVVKFVSSAGKEELGVVVSWFEKIGKAFGVLVFFFVLILSPKIAQFMRMETRLVALLAPALLFFLLGLLYRSILQGLLKFKESVFVGIADILIRLILGLLLVYLGYSVLGALAAIVIGGLVSLIFGLHFIKKLDIPKSGRKFRQTNRVVSYSVPVILTTISSQSLLSTDLVLVKHFFNPHLAGIYASLSTLGKIIFYAVAPVSGVMFPMVSKRHAEKRNYKKIFYFSLLLTLAGSFFIVLIYFFLPSLAVSILFGNKFIEGAPYLFLFGLFVMLYSVSSVFLSMFLSINKTKVVLLPIVFALLQAVGIWFFHSSIEEVIKISLVSVAGLLLSLMLYYAYEEKFRG